MVGGLAHFSCGFIKLTGPFLGSVVIWLWKQRISDASDCFRYYKLCGRELTNIHAQGKWAAGGHFYIRVPSSGPLRSIVHLYVLDCLALRMTSNVGTAKNKKKGALSQYYNTYI